MTREEMSNHYEKLCFQYETIMNVLKQRNLVNLDFAEEQREKFYANLWIAVFGVVGLIGLYQFDRWLTN